MTSQPLTGTPDDSDTAEHGLGLYDAIVNGQHDDVLDQIELAAKARYRLDWRGVPRRLPTGIESAAVQVQIREGYYSPPQGILDDSMRLILEAVHNRRATLQNADMHPVKLTLTTEAFRGLHQRDTVGARAEDGREFTLDPQQFTDEELEALAEGDTLRKRDGATVLAIVVEGYQHERTVFEDVYCALVSSGQVWGLERQEGRSAILPSTGVSGTWSRSRRSVRRRWLTRRQAESTEARNATARSTQASPGIRWRRQRRR